MDFNRMTICGRLTRDPELKYSAEGEPFCRFRVAQNPRDRGVKASSKPLFLECLIWKKNAEACGEHLHKGQTVLVHGTLQVREWTNAEGGKSGIIQLFAEQVEFGPKPRGTAEGMRPSDQDPGQGEEDVPF